MAQIYGAEYVNVLQPEFQFSIDPKVWYHKALAQRDYVNENGEPEGGYVIAGAGDCYDGICGSYNIKYYTTYMFLDTWGCRLE